MRKNMYFYINFFKNCYVFCDFIYMYIVYFIYLVIVFFCFIFFYRNGMFKEWRKIWRGLGRDVL